MMMKPGFVKMLQLPMKLLMKLMKAELKKTLRLKMMLHLMMLSKQKMRCYHPSPRRRMMRRSSQRPSLQLQTIFL